MGAHGLRISDVFLNRLRIVLSDQSASEPSPGSLGTFPMQLQNFPHAASELLQAASELAEKWPHQTTETSHIEPTSVQQWTDEHRWLTA